jgi:large subunit ribosomal protein L23
MKHLLLKPRISEKAYAQSQNEAARTYAFEVPASANKLTVKQAVQSQFEVEVTSVRIVVTKGKAKQSYRKNQRPITGRRSDVKKAYVTLAAGASLPIFVEEAAEEEKAAKQDKKTKKEKK